MNYSRIFLGILILAAAAMFFVFGSSFFIHSESESGISSHDNESVSPSSSHTGNSSTSSIPIQGHVSQEASSSGGSSGSSSGTSGSGCYSQQISYALENVHYTSTCIDEEGTSCHLLEVECFADVRNLDALIEGPFGIHFSVYDGSVGEESFFASEDVNASLAPQASHQFSTVFSFSPESLPSINTVNATCAAHTYLIPQVLTCP